ncbi:MSMEG_1061 family FMN-dependent PPOX-type flavoprotein [Pseudonocardia humida]|uniref:Pyridoxamine 5'-phosphate oxidase family protein n=1 Tax=Pseudonocardia humida TaxID=2800819 RepID=A0ABT0ZUZ7_9PSEU|nr:MSMEG_1061 family FMN-dependent PPOX-type flavoprotein [Pseudonocardia humida]MCO1654555.1 pyridoxamine 5'-phosphate oxidase family protein [Pseudonocardia humida]
MTSVITTSAELRSLVAEPHPAVAGKAVSRIDDTSRRFLESSPFFLLATTAADGTCDVSPRGDPPGRGALVLDEHTIAIADRKGNRRLDSLTNILQNPRVGLLFLVPGYGDTLRLNGTARIVTGAPYLERMAVRGSVPVLAVEVLVEELFLHCAKAFARSSLWNAASWPERAAVPTAGEIVRGQRGAEVSAAAVDEMLARDVATNQY